MYSHIMGSDEELWDVLEDGVGDLVLDEEGYATDRKKHTPAHKKLYKKHHNIRGILVATLPHKEYLKLTENILLKLYLLLYVQIMKVTRKSEKPKLPCLFINMNCSR